MNQHEWVRQSSASWMTALLCLHQSFHPDGPQSDGIQAQKRQLQAKSFFSKVPAGRFYSCIVCGRLWFKLSDWWEEMAADNPDWSLAQLRHFSYWLITIQQTERVCVSVRMRLCWILYAASQLFHQERILKSKVPKTTSWKCKNVFATLERFFTKFRCFLSGWVDISVMNSDMFKKKQCVSFYQSWNIFMSGGFNW